MHKGTLIDDLFAAVERAEPAPSLATRSAASRTSSTEPVIMRRGHSRPRNGNAGPGDQPAVPSESEQFPQPLGLSTADRYLSLLLIVHAQLVGTLEPGDHFADAVDVHQVGAVRPPKKIRV